MVGRPGKYQPRFTAGELDPLIQANTDEAIYFTGASLMKDARPLPQGGFTARDGLRKVQRIRNVLQRVTPYGTIAAPSGGNTALCLDNNPATAMVTNALGGTAVVFTWTFYAGQWIAGFDLSLVSLSTGTGYLLAEVQWEAIGWQQIAPPVALGTTPITPRLICAPGTQPAALAVRLTVQNPTAGATCSITDLFLLNETATVSPVRIRSFTYSRAEAYDAVITANNIDLVDAATGLLLGSVGVGITGAEIAAVKTIQQLETMLLFHQAFAPIRLLRMGAANQWGTGGVPWTNVPNYNFGDTTYTNGVAAQWTLQYFNATTGNHYTVTVNNQTTPALADSGSYATDAAALQAALLALPGIEAGCTVVATGTGMLISFGGANIANGDDFAVSADFIDNANAAVIAAHVTVGSAGGEPIMSTARGWPACGIFYGQRTVMAGFAGAPNVCLASETGNYYELNTLLAASTAPMLIPVDTLGAATILQLHKGRTLDIFCDSGEYWFNGTILDRTQTPNITLGTTNGIAPTVDPVECEGATIFVGAMGGTLLSFKFDYAQQNYTSTNISVRSSSLVKNIVDMQIRRPTAATDTNDLFCVRSDGLGIMVSLLQSENIESFSRMTTDGQFLAVNVNGQFNTRFAIARTVAGATVQFLEQLEAGLLFDGAESGTLGAPGTEITGLFDFEGATVWAQVDGYVQGPFTVLDGAITLAMPGTAWTVGRWSAPSVKTLPQPKDVAPRTVSRRPCRVHTVRVNVVDTSSIAIGANGEAPYDCALLTLAEPTDVPPYDNPYTGEVLQEGLDGFSNDGIVEITQLKPGLFTVTGVTVEVDL